MASTLLLSQFGGTKVSTCAVGQDEIVAVVVALRSSLSLLFLTAGLFVPSLDIYLPDHLTIAHIERTRSENPDPTVLVLARLVERYAVL